MTPDKIYNIGILAHVDAGKTTLTEQFLYLSGALRKAGNVDSGTTQTDWLPIERERGISVRSVQTTFMWKGCQINLIDTPGHVDFSGEVERSLAAIDGAVLVVSAVEGIQSHTETLWRALTKLKIPTLIFINKTDRAGSRFNGICADIPRLLNCEGITLLPLSEVKNEGLSDFAVCEMPDMKNKIIEAVADFNDEIADAFLTGSEIGTEMLKTAFSACVQRREIVPIFGGCAQKCAGIEPLLDAVTSLLPSADKKLCDDLSALIFKIEHDKTMGKIAHVRMYGGELHARDIIPAKDDEPGEKISQIRKFNGQKYMDVGSVGAGDIAALCGLKNAKVFDWVGENPISDTYRLTHPFLSVKVLPKNEAQLMPLLSALRELSDEDPFLNCRWEKFEREILISCTGKIQLEVISSLLRDRYSLSAEFSEPSVIYKETPSAAGYGFEAYTMPKPCWAVLKLKFEPLPIGSGVIYDGGNIPHNTCFYKYQEHIKRSFFDNLQQGPLGWEVTDFKATLVAAEHHTIHTHPLDFFVATPMAIMDGLTNIGTTLLEPFLRVRITAGSEFLGKVISHITEMRGEFDSPILTGDTFTVEASLPVATSLDYPVRLASLTGGKGTFFSVFDGYRPCSLELGKTAKRRGPNPLDRAKWILYARDAISESSKGR